ncbi:MAG: cardiolipin synthase [Lentisphaerae bacterium]|nr:cardiolipin synthase [Lentisphaerota bacterium]
MTASFTVLAVLESDPFRWPWFTIGWLIHLIAFALVTIHCLTNRRESTSAILWIFVAWSFPLIGPLIFLMFGINRVPAKAWRKRQSDQQFMNERRAREDETMPLAYWRSVRDAVAAEPEADPFRALNKLFNAIVPEFPLLGQNRVDPLVTGDEAYPRMLDAIRAAEHHIHLQTFILGNDDTGRRFLDALAEKARAGVSVRLLYDRLGSTHAILSGLVRRYAGIPNMQLVGWTQANPIKRQFQINLRNHRKVLVVDGRRAFTGGINLSQNNVSRDARPPDRDYHFEVFGPIVQELQYSFLGDWYFMTDDAPEALLCEEHFPPATASAGKALVRLLNGSPVSEVEELNDAYFAAIAAAQRQVIAVTPYFVPPPEVICAFRSAALRGVDVRVVVPARNNHLYAGLAGRALYGDLLKAGVRVFERAPPFMHAKAMLVDDGLAIVGSANLDVRSLKLNYETNLAIFDPDFANRLKEILLEDLAFSKELDPAAWERRPAMRKLVENFCSLLTPVL